jgi:outer membrane receptor protein involved in Fe transport
MTKIFSKRLAVLMGCASVMALAHTAQAQTANGLETVIVTVEHRDENSQDVPVSTSTLSGDNLDSIFESGEDIKAIAAHTPSLYAESSNGRVAPRFYIRGLGNSDFDLAASQPVSIIMDDVVMENVVLKSSPLYDQENVEIDRGPQGTLFGRNTTAGIIKFTSVKPSQETSGYLDANTGSYSTSNVQGGFGTGLTDTLSFRASGLWQYRDDYINNAFTGQKSALGGYQERAGRLQFLWKPSDNFSALLNLHGRSLDGTAAIFRANIFTKGSNKLNSNYIYNTVYFDAGANNPQRYDGIGGGLTLNWDFPASQMALTSITGYETTHGYSRGDIDGGNLTGPGIIFFPSESQDGLDFLHQFTQEIRLASTDAKSPLFWQVGAFYFGTQYQDTTYPYFIPPASVRQTNTSFALFGQASYKLDAFTFTGGVRWTTDGKGMTATGPLLPKPITAGQVATRGNNVSWDASAVYALNDDVNFYGRAASGFRAPSIQGRNIAFNSPCATVKPCNYSVAGSETVQSFEAGLKSTLFDHTLRFNADVFQYYVHNMQFSAVGGAAAGNSIVLLNAHGGEAYGLETDVEWVPNDFWDFTLGASWNHTAIRDPNLLVGVCAQCTVTNPLVGGNAKVNNNPFPQAPDYIVSASAKYTYPLGDGSSLFAYTNWWMQGYTNFFLYKSKEFYSNGNYEGDLKLGWTAPSKKYDIYGYIQNITDKQNVQGAIDFDDLTGFVGDPRVIGVGVSVHL